MASRQELLVSIAAAAARLQSATMPESAESELVKVLKGADEALWFWVELADEGDWTDFA